MRVLATDARGDLRAPLGIAVWPVVTVAVASALDAIFAKPDAISPCSVCAAICAGSSLRGLSVVSTATVAPLATAAPIGARFVGSRSPPQPNTQINRPPRDCSLNARSTLLSASGVCA